MKNREVRVFIASMMLVSLVAGSLAGAPVNASEKGNVAVTAAEYRATENKETAKTESETKKSEEKSSKTADKESSSIKPEKDETVYAKIDGSGSVKSVTVSDQLKNISDKSRLEDISDLQDIVNVKGDEAFSTMGSNVVWDTADADICYQGTTTKELPVGIKISYKLDGKDISAADLKGKSGHVVIRYTYENKSGSKENTSTPFMMATGLLLDEEIFKNVKVENGKLISDGERNMVIGYGFPSMKNILGIEDKDVDIPDYFEVEADVTEYEPVEGLTIATNSIFNDLDTDDFDSLDELQDSMGELQDASSQLVSGSGELKNGIDTLLASSGTLTDGIDQLVAGGGDLQAGTSELAAGSSQLLDGSNQLADGSKELADGSKELADGTKQLYDGTKTLASGAGELNAGLKTAASKTSGDLLNGANALKEGIGALQGGLAKLPELGGVITQLNEGVNGKNGLKNGAASMTAGIDILVQQAESGASQMAQQVVNGIDKLQRQIPTAVTSTAMSENMQGATTEIAGHVNAMAASEQQLNDAVNNIASTVANSQNNGGVDTQQMQAQIQAALSALGEAEAALNSVEQSNPDSNLDFSGIRGALSNTQVCLSNITIPSGNGGVDVSSDVNQVQNAAQEMMNQASKVQNSVETLDIPDTTVNNDQMQEIVANLNAGLNQLKSNVQAGPAEFNEQLESGAKVLTDGADQLQEGIDQVSVGVAGLNQAVNDSGMISTLSNGVNQLNDGSKALVNGIGGKDGLASGLNQLAAGAQKLDAGSSELSEKMGEANSGASDLASGASELSNGATGLASGAFSLANGAFQLNDGALTLKNGLNTLQSGSGELIDGVQQLDDGAAELNDGMIRFDKDGIQKLVDAFGGDVEDLLDKMNEMLDASRAYKNFSGISDDMDGEVKFVFVTEE